MQVFQRGSWRWCKHAKDPTFASSTKTLCSNGLDSSQENTERSVVELKFGHPPCASRPKGVFSENGAMRVSEQMQEDVRQSGLGAKQARINEHIMNMLDSLQWLRCVYARESNIPGSIL